jgi:cytochrome c-type biogenesis protein CcmH
MMLAYLIMISMLILSVLFLYRWVSHQVRKDLSQQNRTRKQQAFLSIRRTEIAEEMDAGRLTENEVSQLLLDLDHEADSQKVIKPHWLGSDISLARWVILAIVVVAVLGSVSLYERMGYSKEIVFTKKLQNQTLTPQKISDFLHYRSRRYDRVEDWYYEATDFVQAGKYQEAVVAFEAALSKLPPGANNRVALMAEYAQTIFYANGNQSSVKMRDVVNQILQDEPTQAVALGLKGVAEFDQDNYLGAVLAWQEAVRYNPNSTERLALLSAINKARDAGAIGYEQVPPIVTQQMAIKIQWDPKNIQWQSNDVLLVYALAEGQKMPVAIQRVFPEDLGQTVLLTNLDALMPTATLAEVNKVDVVVKLSNINDNDLTKGQIIGIKEGLVTNRKEIIEIRVSL